jgi:NADH dehydrogenase
MTQRVVFLGSGYAGACTIQSLEDSLDGEANVTWVSDTDYHLVLHESHRCISDPSVMEKITIPIEDVKSTRTRCVQGTVETIDTQKRIVHLKDEEDIKYDYLLVGIGSRTTFFGIHGLEEHAHTLKSLDDALDIHEDLKEATKEATRTDPAQIIIGSAGLSGIQTAGEVAEFRDDCTAPIEIYLVEGLDGIFPGDDPSIQAALRTRLEARDVKVLTGESIGEVNETTVYIGEDKGLDYDVIVWTGGITGRQAIRGISVDKDERNHRLKTGQTFQTDDKRVFAIGDTALVDQHDGDPAPPTAQAAWQAAEVAGENIAHAIRGQPLKEWTYKNKGTVISVDEDAVAHDINMVPFVNTFGGFPALILKKAIATRWIASITSVRDATSAWSDI